MKRTHSALTALLVVLSMSMVHAQYQNVLLGTHASETTIAIDPSNTDRMVAGTNISNYYYSNDGGQNWTNSTLTSTWGNAGDPNVVSDALGSFYYLHLVPDLDRIACQATTTFPPAWNNGTYTGLQPPPKVQDHEWVYGDWNTNNLYVTWSQYDQFTPQSTLDSSHIMFSASYDHGNNWTNVQRLDEVGGDLMYLDVIEPRPYTHPDGTVYVSWASGQGIMLDKSLDSGTTWMAHDQLVTTVPGGVYYSIPGINRIRATPFIGIDKSNGPNRGNIYISWCDQRNGMNNSDIWLIKSTDGGNSWSNSIRVNDDITISHQFLNAMAIDQTNGNIYVCFYDRRNYASDTTDLYLAYSTDGGNSFTNVQVNQQPFVVNASSFFGDYIAIAAHNNVIRPVWASFDATGVAYVYTALIDAQVLLSSGDHGKPVQSGMHIYPSVVQTDATIDFTITHGGQWEAAIYDLYGKKVKDIFNTTYITGNHQVYINAADLSPDIYICELKSGAEKLSVKFVVMK